MGADFGDVRIHQGPEAKEMGAVAFTQGTDVHFAPGAYDPHSQSGKELLGHELAHVVQQRAGRVAVPQGKESPINSDAGLEGEADAAGAKVAAGKSAPIAGAASKSSAAGGPVQAKLEWDRSTLEKAGAISKLGGLIKKTGGGDKYNEILTMLDQYNNDPVLLVNPYDAKLLKLCGDIAAACSVYMTAHAGDTGAEKARVDAVGRLHLAAMTEWNATPPKFGGAKRVGTPLHIDHEDEGHEDQRGARRARRPRRAARRGQGAAAATAAAADGAPTATAAAAAERRRAIAVGVAGAAARRESRRRGEGRDQGATAAAAHAGSRSVANAGAPERNFVGEQRRERRVGSPPDVPAGECPSAGHRRRGPSPA